MRGLVALDLAHNPLGDHGASVLADSPDASGLVDLGLCYTKTGSAEVAALANSTNLTGLRGLDLRGHGCWRMLDPQGVDRGGIGELSRSPMLGRLRRLLITTGSESNGWAADVLRLTRPRRRPTVQSSWWVANELRKSRYLMPSALVECDVEELWWLGDRGKRERLPDPWRDGDW
jgi:hypothetical protein